MVINRSDYDIKSNSIYRVLGNIFDMVGVVI